ncbi:MAG: 1,4-beta-xylanase [Balneola sp.]|jgi:endo-1,4-beta-xylanase|nr:1,4-beta-xylanase [Balneola sp.]MBE79951.1 1,4-beta-xylanase [Balneola sp.]|tara:strand:+ start:2413 stop:3522 length:1110 start_codon:yes stop_codon:yes gene_type:complete
MRDLVLLLIGLFLAVGCTQKQQTDGLKDAYKDDFYIGAAVNTSQYSGRDARALPILKEHFNSITPENDLKWENIHPERDTYNFEEADKFVEFGVQNEMFIVGHTLVWHSQTPDWVFEDEEGNPISREELLARMKDHIYTVVGRYRGKIDGWDVVNEAVNDDGTIRESPWYNIIGKDYIAKAFQFAHEADPEAELYYNDYNLHLPDKADAAAEWVKEVQDSGVRVTGIGMQGHYGLDYPTKEALERSINLFGELGIVAITELDIDVLPSPFQYTGADISRRAELRDELNPYTENLPDSMVQKQTDQFKLLFEVFHKQSDVINRVTTWGVTDGDSWKNGWPMPGRTNYPLLFDREGNPKPAVEALKDIATN